MILTSLSSSSLHLLAKYNLSWPIVTAVVVAYVIGSILYRLTLQPLSHFPGPTWTAITRYYEGYYDLIKSGQYTFKIKELHRKYGPIVRISPYELHINDPAFFNTLYRQDAHFDKSAFALDAFAAYGASLLTISHHVHKIRRQPLNLYFSKTKVATRQNLIHRHLAKLCSRFRNLGGTGVSFDFGAAITAFARDVSNDFVLGKSYNSLDLDDFDVAMMDASQGGGGFWHLSKFVRWFGPTMQGLPLPWVLKVTKGPMNIFFRHLWETQKHVKKLMTGPAPSSKGDAASRSVVHEIMNSGLPPAEKKFRRVWEDASTMTGAGAETTASVLRLILFHIYSDKSMLHRLRKEVSTADRTAQDESLDLKTLEQLPYLTAVIMEGLRLSPAIGTRMGRVSPEKEIHYNEWRIPAGTVVGMTLVLMHVDESIYPEPQSYSPSRWLEDGNVKKVEHGFAPFSKGTRNCLGMHLAWAELYITIAELVQCFEFRFEGATSEDFACTSDQFAIGTNGKGHVQATVALCQS